MEQFLVAAMEGDVAGLERPARFVATMFPRLAADPALGGSAEVSEADVNGEPALVAWVGSGLYAVVIPEVTAGRITALRAAANPDKLGFAARQAASLSRSERLSGLVLVTDDR